MYNDEYLARHKHHPCYGEYYYPYGINTYGKMRCAMPYAYCPYIYTCPLMQQLNIPYGYSRWQMTQTSDPTVNDFTYREQNSENLFRHPYGHMSYYYYDDNSMEKKE